VVRYTRRVPPKLKTLAELTKTTEPAIDLLREWARHAENPCEILPPSDRRDEVLLGVQVTTHSSLGALAYETGGVLIDGGWLRFLGSGHSRLTRDLVGWNERRAHGAYLIADDAVGGFFALNGGALGADLHRVYYWPPDSLEWMPLKLGLSDFLRWSLTRRIDAFYQDLRWPSWREDRAALSGDHCFSFYPFLWSREGSIERSRRSPVPAAEQFDMKVSLIEQVGGQ
jgi:hypothetical protein